MNNSRHPWTLALAALLLYPVSTRSQSPQPPPEERGPLTLAALEAVRDSADPRLDAGRRIWLGGWFFLGATSWESEPFAPDAIIAIRSVFTGTRITGPDQWLYDCEEETARRETAGIACPILENGLIVTVGLSSRQPEETGLVRIDVGITSEWQPGRTHLIGWGVWLRKSEAGLWVAEQVRHTVSTDAHSPRLGSILAR